MDFKNIIQKFSGIVSTKFMVMMVIISLLLIFYDSKNLEKLELDKDSKIAKYTGIVYLFLGIGLYVVTKFI